MAACGSHTKDCIEGIRKALDVPDFALKCASDVELCEILSDGEILCNLLTELSNGRVSCEGALTASIYSANSIVLASKNLKYFLSQCREVFGLEEHEMFEPDDLLTMSNPERVVRTILRLVSVTSSSKVAEPSHPKQKSSCLTINVMKEICDHELALTDKLIKLLMYRNELMGLLCEWSEELVHVVFKHVEQLYSVHKEFHAKLTSLAEQGCEQFCQQLATLFSYMIPKLEIYINYFTHLPAANFRMETEFEKAPELKTQLAKLERHFKGHSFRGLYDSPIRQTTNYLQLFRRLQESAKEEMPETSKSLENGIIELEALLDRANSFKKHAELLTATKVVLDQVIDLPSGLANPTEVGLHQADDCCKVRIGKDRKIDTQQGLCILTTKQLIVATKAAKKDSQATFLLTIPIVSSLQVKKCDRGGSLKIIGENGEQVTIEDLKSKDKWFKLLSGVKADNFPDGWNTKGHTFELKTFPSGTKCSRCCKQLTGIVMQGYNCSHCDKQLHVHCYKQLISLTAKDFDHKTLERAGAEELLKNENPGAFLLRNCRIGGTALSIRSVTKVEHINVLEIDGKFSLCKQAPGLNGLDELLDYYWVNKLSLHFKAIDCTLGDGIEASTNNQRLLKSGMVECSEF